MSNQDIYNIGTTVYYAGDESNQAGYGKITDQVVDYLDDVQLEITLRDGRVISNVTPAEFEARNVLGNSEMAEFHLVDTWDDEIQDWDEDDITYHEENGVQFYSL
jgi:hypothetical protein